MTAHTIKVTGKTSSGRGGREGRGRLSLQRFLETSAHCLQEKHAFGVIMKRIPLAEKPQELLSLSLIKAIGTLFLGNKLLLIINTINLYVIPWPRKIQPCLSNKNEMYSTFSKYPYSSGFT